LNSFWLILKQQWTIKISSPFFFFSLAAILVGSRDHWTQFWKGAIQGPFHQSLVQIGPMASEELIKMWKVKITFKSSPLKPLNQIKPNLAGMVPWWVPFKIVSNSPALHSRWGCWTQFWKGPTRGPSLPGLVQFGSAVSEEKI
jgi:hypothetical protein